MTAFATGLDQLPGAAQRVVAELRSGLAGIFGEDLVAVWLYGGLLFAPGALDIDLHVLLGRGPTEEERARIAELHAAASGNRPWVDELDAWYMLLEDARRPEPPANVGPHHPGKRDQHWSLHRAHWLAGACIVAHGMLPAEVVPAPSWAELRSTLRDELVAEARNGGRDGGAASSYWTLQLCRVVASLETRDVVRSKLDSGTWALQRLPAPTHSLIRAAMRYYTRSSGEGDEALIRDRYPDFYAIIRPLIETAAR